MNVKILMVVVFVVGLLASLSVARLHRDWVWRAMPYNHIVIAVCFGYLSAIQHNLFRSLLIGAISVCSLAFGIIALVRRHKPSVPSNDKS